MAKTTGVLFIALALLGQTHFLQAATYYVDSYNGDDSWDGTQPAFTSAGIGPWQSIAHVNQSTLLPGDTVRFIRGGKWHDELVVPHSGISDALPITFTNYGDTSADLPVISCADDVSAQLWQGVIANGGFEYTDPTQTNTVFPGWIGSSNLAQISPGYNSSHALYGSAGFTSVKSTTLHMQQDVEYTISGALRGAGGSSRVEVEIFVTTPSKQYLDSTGNWQPWDPNLDPPGGVQPLKIVTDTQWTTFELPFTGVGSNTAYVRVSVFGEGWADDIKLVQSGASAVDYWTTHWEGFGPEILIEDGERIAWGSEWDPNSAWHVGSGASRSVRYIPPAGTVPQDHTLELGVRRNGIRLEDKDYIVLEGLKVTGCGGHPAGAATLGGVGIQLHKGSSHNLIKDITLDNNRQGLQVFGKSDTGEFNTDNVIDNVRVYNSIQKGIAIQSESSDSVIRNSLVTDMSLVVSDDVMEDKEAISIGGNTGNGGNLTIEYNTVTNIGPNFLGSTGTGITFFNSPNTIVRYNTLTDIGRHGIALGTNNVSPYGFNVDGARIYGNVVRRTGISPGTGPGMPGNVGIGIGLGASDYSDIDDVRVYNNTVLDCELHDNKDGGISIKGVANPNATLNRITNVKIYNNVVAGCSGTYPRALFYGNPAIIDLDLTTFESNNNVLEPGPGVGATSRFVVYNGTNYTLEDFDVYQSSENQDLASVVAAPLLVDPASGDYTPTANSPLIDNSDPDLLNALPYSTDRAGKPVVGARDIGALEFGTRSTADLAATGTVQGDHAVTHISDNLYQSLTEERARNGRDSAAHVWVFDASGGGDLTLNVEAWRDVTSDGDNFAFFYSTNGTTYSPANLVVSKSSDDNTIQSVSLPSGINGVLYIKAEDTDIKTKRGGVTTLYVDQLYLQSH